MKKIPTPPAATSARGWIHQAARYLVRGILAGILFQGTFLMFNFENRIIRSVTSNRLEEIKALQEETGRRIRKGQKPLIDLSLLREQYVEKLKQNEDSNN